jgi:hypothetical protein
MKKTFLYTWGPGLKSSWTQLITQNWIFVKVRGRSLFWTTSFCKWWTSYNAPPTSRKLAADRWSLQNFLLRSSLFVVEKAQKSHGKRPGLYDGCSKGVPSSHFFQAEHRIQFRYRPMRFLGFSNHAKGAPVQEISKWSTVCNTFSRSGWSVVGSASLAKGGTSKRRMSLHLHRFPTRSNKASPRTFQKALVHFNSSDFTQHLGNFIWNTGFSTLIHICSSYGPIRAGSPSEEGDDGSRSNFRTLCNTPQSKNKSQMFM